MCIIIDESRIEKLFHIFCGFLIHFLSKCNFFIQWIFIDLHKFSKITNEKSYSRNDNHGFLGPWRISLKKPVWSTWGTPTYICQMKEIHFFKKSLGANFRPLNTSEGVVKYCILFLNSHCKNMLNPGITPLKYCWQ
jgi:hypothetical protein